MSPKFVRPWLHEPKLDGYRFQIVKEGRQMRLYGRRGHELRHERA